MTMKNFILLFTFFLFAGGLFSQDMMRKRADKYYDRFAYSKAAGIYEQLSTAPRTDEQMMRRLGNCYVKLGQWGKAEQCYAKLANGASPDAEIYYNYAQALRGNGKYSESLPWMEKFSQAQSADSRGKAYSQSASFIEAIEKQQPYFELQPLDINSSEADFGAAFDNGKIAFASARGESPSVKTFHTWNGRPFLDIYVADRDPQGKLSNASTLNKTVNTKYHEGPACFSADGNTLFFTRNNYFKKKYGKDAKGVNNLKIFRAVLKDGAWTEENLPVNSDDYSVGHPALTADGQWLYFVSDMPGGRGGTDLYRMEVKADGSFGTPENLGEKINTEGNEMFPFVDADNNIFFASNGHVGLGGLDIFYASAGHKGGFGKIMNVGKPVNTQWDDFALVLDKENKSGYISSNREGGKGDDDLYALNMLRPLRVSYMIKGIVKDKNGGAPLEGTVVVLKDEQGNTIKNLTTGPSGEYAFDVEPAKNYTLDVTKEKYFEGKNLFNTNELAEKTEMIRDLELEKDPGLSLYCLVTDKQTKAPLEGVKITILDNMNGQNFADLSTPVSGDFRKPVNGKKIGDRLSYQVRLDKNGYLGKTVVFNTEITKEGEIKVHEALDLTLDKIAVGADLAKIIDIKPIYFDLGKWNIRKDAAIELDKIVKVMKENPGMIIELGSHTDCRSSAQSNLVLSDKRAKSSAAYIISKGIESSRISGKGYGEAKLINGCACEGAVKSTCSEAEHQANRRTEFIIVKM
ncbi:MAG: OmpA/MotB domain-containing protein [Bacteroidetes bacterium]|nr:MAG: OmpA/MotB domain-containing protein [Bacteroidota bacterium]